MYKACTRTRTQHWRTLGVGSVYTPRRDGLHLSWPDGVLMATPWIVRFSATRAPACARSCHANAGRVRLLHARAHPAARTRIRCTHLVLDSVALLCEHDVAACTRHIAEEVQQRPHQAALQRAAARPGTAAPSRRLPHLFIVKRCGGSAHER